MTRIIIAFLLFISGLALAVEPTPVAKQEIAYLLSYLKGSGCDFNRNGTWYDAEKAVNHLNTKYEYLLKKGFVYSTEDFIKRAATASSMSRKPYLVRCGSNTPIQSNIWFRAELAKYRAGRL